MFRVNAKAITCILGGTAGITRLAAGIGALIDACTKYDEDGYDTEKYDREGYSRTCYDRQGYGWQSYGRDQYNASSLDRAGHCRQYYSGRIEQLRDHLDETYQQLQRGEFRYAIYDARVVMKDALRMTIHHSECANDSDNRILINLKICLITNRSRISRPKGRP